MLDAGTLDGNGGRPVRARPRVRPLADPAAQPGAARSDAVSRQRRRGIGTGLVSGIAGFVVGAVFWHFVGFWSFLSHVVLKGPADAEGRIEQSPVPPAQPVKVAGRLKDALRFRDLGTNAGYLQAAVGAGNCAEVRFDRASGQTGVQACSLSSGNLPSTGTVVRSDRLRDATAKASDKSRDGWSVQVQAGD